MLRHTLSASFTVLVVSVSATGCQQEDVDTPGHEEWISLFDGTTLDGWIPKIRGHAVNVNFGNTFRVQDSLLVVRYDQYGNFDDQFGHLFYREPFSFYRIAIEYRFVGEQARGGAGWARRNSGVMLHAQDPQTMGREQDFPISIEVQFLGGLDDGELRPTGNVCTPGTEILMDGRMAANHCIESRSETFPGDQWVVAEAIVLGDSLVVHIINGDTVLHYTNPQVGGGVVAGFDPAVKIDGTPLTAGYIALQSESHPIDVRSVRLLNLVGCTDPAARNFKRYYVKSEPSACQY